MPEPPSIAGQLANHGSGVRIPSRELDKTRGDIGLQQQALRSRSACFAVPSKHWLKASNECDLYVFPARCHEVLMNSVRLPVTGLLKFATPGTTRRTPSTVPPGTSRPGSMHSTSIIPSSTPVVPTSCTRNWALPPLNVG